MAQTGGVQVHNQLKNTLQINFLCYLQCYFISKGMGSCTFYHALRQFYLNHPYHFAWGFSHPNKNTEDTDHLMQDI
jgi:hypothetical protein